MAEKPGPINRANEPVSRDVDWLLAIDTSTEQTGIGLFDGTAIWSLHWPASRNQTTTVAREIDALLQRSGIDLSGIGAIAVSIGPGSFTGMRVGLSLAKGMALARELPLIGVPTLDLILHQYRLNEGACVAAISAGRGRVAWTTVAGTRNPMDVRNTTIQELIDWAGSAGIVLVAGELTPEWRSRLMSRGVEVAPAVAGLQRAGVLAELGYARWQVGDLDDIDSLEPIYVHGRPNPR